MSHAEFSPSAMPRIARCAASHTLSLIAPPEGDSPHAAKGTYLHDCVAESILLGKPIEKFKDLDTSDIETCDVYIDYVHNLPDGKLTIEHKVKVLDCYDCGGTCDALHVDVNTLRVIDFKTGYHPVPADSWQLKCYAIGAYKLYRERYDIQEVMLVIVQPQDHGNEIKELTFPASVIDTWEKDLFFIIARTQVEFPEANPCEEACRFCPAKTICPDLADKVRSEAAQDFTTFDVADIEEKLAFVALARIWADGVEKRAFSLLMQGQSIEGYKLVEGRSLRKWADNDSVYAAMTAAELNDDEIFEKKLISPARAEKLLGKKHEILTTYVTKPPGKPTLALASDKRPPLSPADSAKRDFADAS